MLDKNKKFFRGKKGQVGDTVTWVVATIVIIVLLMFFIFGTSLLADARKAINLKDPTTSENSLQKKDLFLEKSLFTYFQIQDLGEKSSIYLRLKNLEEKGFFEESLEEKEAEIGGRLA